MPPLRRSKRLNPGNLSPPLSSKRSLRSSPQQDQLPLQKKKNPTPKAEQRKVDKDATDDECYICLDLVGLNNDSPADGALPPLEAAASLQPTPYAIWMAQRETAAAQLDLLRASSYGWARNQEPNPFAQQSAAPFRRGPFIPAALPYAHDGAGVTRTPLTSVPHARLSYFPPSLAIHQYHPNTTTGDSHLQIFLQNTMQDAAQAVAHAEQAVASLRSVLTTTNVQYGPHAMLMQNAPLDP
ncbi:hypothetical protein HDU93_003370, partial [Gonapodya sp. JEL0774]